MIRGAGAILCGVVASTHVLAETLSYEQAVERALEADPRIDEQQHLVEAAQGLLEEVLGKRDLMFDANAFVGLTTGVEGGFFKDDGETPRGDRYQPEGLSPWFNLQFKVIKPLYTFGKVEHYAAAAKGNIRVKEGEVELQRGNTILQVSQAYFGYLAARDTRHLFEDVKKRVQRAIDMVEEWLEEGSGQVKQSDLFALRSGMALVNKYLWQAKALENVALDGLKVLTGIGLDGDLEIADKRLTALPQPDGKLTELQTKALAQRPEMNQLKAGLQARRALVEAKKSEVMPDLYAGFAGFASLSPMRETLRNPFIYDPFNDYGATPLVGIRWQWEQGSQPARVKQAQSELDALVDKSAFARKGIPFEVAEQYHKVVAYREAVQNLKEGSRSARRWMISSFADFQAGIEEPVKVMEAFQGYILTYSDYLTTLNDYDMHVVRLKYVTGAY